MAESGERVLPQCAEMHRELKEDVSRLERIVRGDNGEGLVTKMRVLSEKLELIYRLMWISVAGIIALVIERIADKVF